MSTITIECRRCHREHTAKLAGQNAAQGGFNCQCGMKIYWSTYHVDYQAATGANTTRTVNENG